MRQARVGAAEMFRNFVAKLAEPFYMNFVDDGLVEFPSGRVVLAPVEALVDDHGFRHVPRAVAVVALQVVAAQRIRKHRVIPLDVAADRLRIRIDQQLCRMTALPLCRIPWPVHAKTVALPGTDTRQVAMPAERGVFRQANTPFVTGVIEEA